MTQVSILAETMSSNWKKCVSEKLEKTDNYLKQNKLTMNTGKTELLCVSTENENFDPIVFRGQEIKPQGHCRYSGIIIDSKFKFHVQINKVLSNMATAIRSIYLLRYQLPLRSTIDAIQIPSPFSFNIQCSIFSELEFLCNAANSSTNQLGN